MVGSINGDTPIIIRPTGEVRTEPCLALQQPVRSLLALSGGRRTLHATHPHTSHTGSSSAHRQTGAAQPSVARLLPARTHHHSYTQANTSECSQYGGG